MDNDLKAQAEELGIKVDGRWSDDRLQQEIDSALAAVPGEATMPVKLKYDTWLKEDERTAAGAIIDVPLSMAKRLIAGNKADRADPLPGEE